MTDSLRAIRRKVGQASTPASEPVADPCPHCGQNLPNTGEVLDGADIDGKQRDLDDRAERAHRRRLQNNRGEPFGLPVRAEEPESQDAYRFREAAKGVTRLRGTDVNLPADKKGGR